MKKLFFIAAVAATMVGCSNEELSLQDNQVAQKNQPGVKFDVYAQRGITRGGGQTGDLNNANIGANGFGVFAYYTAGEKYDANAKPNFMYNQQVTCEGTATAGTLWTYEPVKYWPNEFGNAAQADEVDYVTFFAYAPWTNIEPTTGEIIPGPDKDADHEQNFNIISVNKNTQTGDPIVKYAVDTDPATSVDLLWGVAAPAAENVYAPIDGEAGTKQVNKDVKVETGMPFLDLVKPNNPANDRLMFNLKHALAKVKVTIDYISDVETPMDGTYPSTTDPKDTYASVVEGGATAAPDPASQAINEEQTRIFVRSFKIDGLAMKGALNLNNTVAGEPLWKDFDGVKDLAFGEVTFFDGRKDGKEGDVNGAQNNENPQGLNPEIVENYSQTADGKFGADKNPGVKMYTGDAAESQLLFGGDANENDGYFYVIPRNEGSPVSATIVYDVETIDPALAGLLSDNFTHGLSIENVITKENIFGDNVDFKAGYQYWIKIHVGMTSVKIEATVTPWVENGETIINLPDNQNPWEPEMLLQDWIDLFNQSGGVTATFNINGSEVELTSADNAADGYFKLIDFVGEYAKIEIADITAEGYTLPAGEYYVNFGKAPEQGTALALYTLEGTQLTAVEEEQLEPARATRSEEPKEEQEEQPTVGGEVLILVQDVTVAFAGAEEEEEPAAVR